MSLFQVPGWDVPSAPVANSKKRKRPSAVDPQLKEAERNMEKLMKQLGQSGPVTEEKQIKDTSKRPKLSKDDKKNDKTQRKPTKEDSKPNSHRQPKERDFDISSPQQKSKTKKQSKREPGEKKGSKTQHTNEAQPSKSAVLHTNPRKKADVKKSTPNPPESSNLTALQAKMKSSLEGARFRWINETLYKSDSKEAHMLMQSDSSVFHEYHTGFRHQVTSWPSNPVDGFIEDLKPRSRGTVIVDLGCGDAALAQELVPLGLTVLSFDLISTNSYVIEADICGKLPLPGDESSDVAGQVVDIVVCSLSLMSTNWLNCIREARRVLKQGGELKIAEVASRFSSVDEFVSAICEAGFTLLSKDESNTHFVLVHFKKSGKALDDAQWGKLMARGDILQPCEYKRR